MSEERIKDEHDDEIKEDNRNKYLPIKYDDSTLLIRKTFLPLIICPGKRFMTYWYTIPEFQDEKFNKVYRDWFYREFNDIISEVCKKRNITLPKNQKNPSYKRAGWYLPYAVHIEIVKMWTKEEIPIIYDILRPSFKIYDNGQFDSYIRELL